MSRGRWTDRTRQRRRPWTVSDYDLLRELVTAGADWYDISEALGYSVATCRQVARLGGLIHPGDRAETQLFAREFALAGINQPVSKETFQEREDRYVAELMRLGGFCRREIVGGRVVEIYP